MTRQADYLGEPTLTQLQQRALQGTVAWFFVALGIILGWVAAFSVAASGGGDGVFGVDSSGVYLSIVAHGLVLACFVVGACVSASHQREARHLVLEFLRLPPVSGPVASAVLIRTVLARRTSDAHQLLYAAHPQGEAVRAVLVPVLQGSVVPRVGSGAWLVMNQQMPAFASFFMTDAAQHDGALADPAFAKLTRVQRGLAVPARTYLVPTLIGVAGLLVSLIGFSILLGTFG